jgi:hypothetical protein
MTHLNDTGSSEDSANCKATDIDIAKSALFDERAKMAARIADELNIYARRGVLNMHRSQALTRLIDEYAYLFGGE